MKYTGALTNTLVIHREGDREIITRDANGDVFVQLDNYVVLPKEQYERLVILAGRQADLMVADVLKIRHQPFRRAWRAIRKFWWGQW